MADSSKTEKATPKKRRDERKKGNIFLSKDAVTVATLISSFFVLKVTAPGMVEQFHQFFLFCFAQTGAATAGQAEGFLSELTIQALLVMVKSMGPLLAVTVLAALGATFAQTRLLFSADSIKPKFNRISPLQGFKRLFSLRSLVGAMKGALQITILLFIMYQYLTGLVVDFANYMNSDLWWVCGQIFAETFGMVMQIIVAFTVLAAFDFFYQWWDYERQLKMSKQEIKEEYKQMEGDPKIKSKIKETQRRMAQSRMMQQVPHADVVIRNPTHFAVALRYKPEQDPAPVVLAKGMDELALRIVKVAEEHKIVTIENVPLARALYASAEVNREIPPELYGAVAEVLVYLYRIDAGDT